MTKSAQKSRMRLLSRYIETIRWTKKRQRNGNWLAKSWKFNSKII